MFRTALTALAGLSVTGINHNYDVHSVPDVINRGQLPVLLVLPVDTGIDSGQAFFNERAGGFEAIAFSGGMKTVEYTVTHLLLVAPVAAGSGSRSHLPALIDLIDHYFTALSASMTLDGALLEPAHVRVDPGIFTYGQTDYYGCVFRHLWRIAIT